MKVDGAGPAWIAGIAQLGAYDASGFHVVKDRIGTPARNVQALAERQRRAKPHPNIINSKGLFGNQWAPLERDLAVTQGFEPWIRFHV